MLTVPDSINADVVSDAENIAVENLSSPERIADGRWRFGSGGPTFNLDVGEGSNLIRGTGTLTDTK